MYSIKEKLQKLYEENKNTAFNEKLVERFQDIITQEVHQNGCPCNIEPQFSFDIDLGKLELDDIHINELSCMRLLSDIIVNVADENVLSDDIPYILEEFKNKLFLRNIYYPITPVLNIDGEYVFFDDLLVGYKDDDYQDDLLEEAIDD